MNEQENNKANAAILLSADEAVEKKIIAVLTKHPHIIQQALDTIERERMAYQSQQYQQHLNQAMLDTKNKMAQGLLNRTFTTSNTSGLLSNTYNNTYGGKK